MSIHTAHFIFISVLIYEAKLQLRSIPTIRADKLDYIPGMYSFPTTSLSPEKSTSKKWGPNVVSAVIIMTMNRHQPFAFKCTEEHAMTKVRRCYRFFFMNPWSIQSYRFDRRLIWVYTFSTQLVQIIPKRPVPVRNR